MGAITGIFGLDTSVSIPEFIAEHHEQMGFGHIRLHFPDLAYYLPHDVRLRGTFASYGYINKDAAPCDVDETVQGPPMHWCLHGAQRQSQQSQPCANIFVPEPGHQVRFLPCGYTKGLRAHSRCQFRSMLLI